MRDGHKTISIDKPKVHTMKLFIYQSSKSRIKEIKSGSNKGLGVCSVLPMKRGDSVGVSR